MMREKLGAMGLILRLCRCAGGLTVETTDWERLEDNTKVEEKK
jgi:hypothetical protein